MGTLLIVDDDYSTRKETLLRWWVKTHRIDVNDVIVLTEYPEIGLTKYLQEHPGITYVSLDHDLGSSDVSSELSREFWELPHVFPYVWKNKTVVIHSMNVPGAINIANKFTYVGNSVTVIPLSKM